MAITTDDFNKIWASESPLTPYSFSASQYKEGWNFIGSTPPSRQMWDFLQKNNDEKMQYLLNHFDNYLPLSGGTMTGAMTTKNVTVDGQIEVGTDHSAGGGGFILPISQGIRFEGSTSGTTKRGRLELSGTSGEFSLTASNAEGTYKTLLGKPNGTLTWDGQPIQTSSDKRLKQDFSDVPADVLEAWGKVEWKQFKYKDDVKRKGDSCRFHTGLVAQDVKEVGEANNVDLLKYGILCHDVREAVEEEKDEDGNVIKEASEAVDLWTVRYEEALAMEVIYLRSEIKKLHEEIKALRS